ncbi:hypothetical protein B0H14DRAFT_2586742 [Mycena olivaceomarginata]|nr:hypothetical protein B0H14DRAFT_2586742 [Mycena olivaceomarginata]
MTYLLHLPLSLLVFLSARFCLLVRCLMISHVCLPLCLLIFSLLSLPLSQLSSHICSLGPLPLKIPDSRTKMLIESRQQDLPPLLAVHIPTTHQILVERKVLGKTWIVNEPHALGDSGKAEGWIWQNGYYTSLSAAKEAEYVLDYRAQLHRAHTDMKQWQEVEILGQGFHHPVQGFHKMEAV